MRAQVAQFLIRLIRVRATKTKGSDPGFDPLPATHTRRGLMKLFRISTIPLSLSVLLKGQLRFLNRHFDVTAVSGQGKDLEHVRQREGVKVHAIEMQRQIAPIRDLVSLWNLYRFFKREKPHIIHSITPKAGLLSMVAGKWAGVPVRMHTFTGLIFPYRSGGMQKILVWMDRFLCSHATHIYPEGAGVREDLLKYRITDKPLKIIADGNVNGIDTEWFSVSEVETTEKEELRNRLGISPEDFVFVFVGRLVKDKGINELVTAFKNLNLNFTPSLSLSKGCLKLLLVGPLEQDLDPLFPETLAEIDNNPNIIAVGFQQDVRPYFAISNALVFPSYREGFPNVVLQAGAMELPSVVTDISGCNEIISHRKNGLIIPVRNVAALEKTMAAMLKDEQLYRTLKAHARPMILSRYRQEVVWEALLEEYREVAE